MTALEVHADKKTPSWLAWSKSSAKASSAPQNASHATAPASAATGAMSSMISEGGAAKLVRILSELGDGKGREREREREREMDKERGKAAVGMARDTSAVPAVIVGAVEDDWPLYS